MRHFVAVEQMPNPFDMACPTRYKLVNPTAIKTADENTSVPFCNCEYPVGMRWRHSTKKTVKCKCGEDASTRIDWTWDAESTSETVVSGTEVIFHPVYSQGTSVVRGNEPLMRGRHHYWEIKILSTLSGTDIMFGIGTDKVDLRRHRFAFASVLGLDDQSWGYSYRGLAQHNGQLKYYGKKFSQGRIIGIYVDMHRGSIEYFLNRRSLGRAYEGIPREEEMRVYPMVSSTSAKSSIKLINAASFEDSLRFSCMKVISKYPKLLEQVNGIPGLKQTVQELWFLQFKESKRPGEFALNNLHLADEAVLYGKKQKHCGQTANELEINSEAEIYDNLLKKEDVTNDSERSSSENSSHSNSDNSDTDDLPVMVMKDYFCNH